MFNEQYAHAFDAVLNISTIAVHPPPVGGLDLISAKVQQSLHMQACSGQHVSLHTRRVLSICVFCLSKS